MLRRLLLWPLLGAIARRQFGETGGIWAFCAGLHSRKLHRYGVFFHLVKNYVPDQCLQPYSEENRLGFAKVGLGCVMREDEVASLGLTVAGEAAFH